MSHSRYAPVLVEATLALFADVLSPDGLQGSQATRSLDVSDNSNGDLKNRISQILYIHTITKVCYKHTIKKL